MKKLTILTIFLSALAANLHGYTIGGTAATGLSNFSSGNSTFLIVDTSGNDTLDTSFFTAGVTLTAGTSVGDYFIAAQNSIAGVFGLSISGNASFNIDTGPAAANDYFYIAAFGTNSTASVTIAGGNTFDLLSDSSWRVGATNGLDHAFGSGGQFTQLTSANGAANLVAAVPEPSAYALLGGLLALTCVMLRRRA